MSSLYLKLIKTFSWNYLLLVSGYQQCQNDFDLHLHCCIQASDPLAKNNFWLKISQRINIHSFEERQILLAFSS